MLRRESEHAKDESEEGDSIEEETAHEEEISLDTEEGIDISSQEAEAWLKRIGLYDYARLPWIQWKSNPLTPRCSGHTSRKIRGMCRRR